MASRKDEIVESRVSASPAVRESPLPQTAANSRVVEQRTRGDGQIARLSDQEKRTEPCYDLCDRRKEVVEEHDVGVDERPKRVAGRAFDQFKGAVEPRCASIVSYEPSEMLDARLSGGLLDAVLIAHEDDLEAGIERAPAFEGIPLNAADPTAVRLRDGEQRQHARRLAADSSSRAQRFGASTMPVVASKTASLSGQPEPTTRTQSEQAGGELPIHFFTIVLNGEPFIRYHLDVLRELPCRWQWHVVEGVASLVHDTAWSVAGGGRIDPAMHTGGLSTDGTTAYLDEVAAAEPDRVSLYRPSPGNFWQGKREMVSAPLANIREECLLWEIDADELWTSAQIERMRELFIEQPERTAAYYWCDYFVGPSAVITTRYNWAQDPRVEWLRTWRFRPGDHWRAHEPPTLVRGQSRPVDVGEGSAFPSRRN